MTEQFPVRTLLLALVAGNLAAAALAAAAPTPVDRAIALPLSAVIIASFFAPRPWRAALLSAAPLLLLLRIAVPDERLRLLLAGAVAASVLAAAFAAAARRGRIGRVAAFPLLALALALVRFLPPQLDQLPANALTVAGCFLLLHFSFSRDGTVGTLAPLVVLAAGAWTPVAPLRAALLPLALALLVAAIRRRSLPAWGALAVVAAVAGRWAWPLALLPLIPLASARFSSAPRPAGIVPPFALAVTAPLRFALFLPAIFAALARRPAGDRIAAGALLVLALFVRPSLAMAYLLSAAAILLIDGEPDVVMPLRLPTFVFAIAILVLAPWSGIVTAAFPLPLALPAVALIAVTAIAATVGRGFLAGAIGAAVVVAAVLLHPAAIAWEPVGVSLSPGERFAVAVPGHPTSLRLTISLANLADRGERFEVGAVELLDARGGAWRRTLTVGDVADWGAFRPHLAFVTRNPLPRQPASAVEGYGRSAWLRGSGVIELELPAGIAAAAVRASDSLPPGTSVQFEAIGVAP